MPAARSSPSASATSVTATAAPSRAIISQVAAPMPCAPPVTIATLFDNRPMGRFPPVLSRGHANGLADHLGGIAPLVVVPGHHLDEVAGDHLGHRQIDQGAVRIADD